MSAASEPRGLTDAERFGVKVREAERRYYRVRPPVGAECPGTGLDVGALQGDSQRCPVCGRRTRTNADGGLRRHPLAKNPSGVSA